MRIKQLSICFFLGYLVLLLNLGSSLHRAHFFGLHSHSGSSLCDLHHFSCCDGSGHSDSEPLQGERTLHTEHDCGLCKFFDQYNVTTDLADHQLIVSAGPIYKANRLPGVFTPLLIQGARGPPKTT